MNKIILLIIGLLVHLTSFSQEINIGPAFGAGLLASNKGLLSAGIVIEYKPKNLTMSFNIEPVVLFSSVTEYNHVYPEKAVGSIPVYVKFFIGNKLRFCPFAGGLITTTSAGGITAGLIIDYRVKDCLYLFLKNDYNLIYYKTIYPSHFPTDPPQTTDERASLFWISCGVKVNVFKPKDKKIIRI